MISEKLSNLIAEIKRICLRSGRNISDIKVVAASKNAGLSLVREAYNAGLKEFGENKAQELRDKAALLKDINVIWHFFGHLQKNKIKYVVDNSDLIHSVDSIELVEELQNYSEKKNKVQNILIEIKTSGEASKFGMENKENILRIVEICKNSRNLKLLGLMTMAPFTDNENIIRDSFKRLKELFDELNGKGAELAELSMGMSGDYRIAIEEGSTIIRVGTAIFGERDYSKSWKEQ